MPYNIDCIMKHIFKMFYGRKIGNHYYLQTYGGTKNKGNKTASFDTWFLIKTELGIRYLIMSLLKSDQTSINYIISVVYI